MCDSANPIVGGACPVKDTGPPNVTFPLLDAIKTPQSLRSRTEGSWGAIGDNIKAIDYYIDTLGVGQQYQGYGGRAVYDTGIKCSNLPGTAHRLADGTAAGVGGHGLVPRILGSLGGLIPSDLVSSAKDELPCRRLLLHYNTHAEMNAMRERRTGGVPAGNRIPISDSKGVNYTKVHNLCSSRRLSPCQEVPVATQDIAEGFASRSRVPVQSSISASTSTSTSQLFNILLVLGGIIVLIAVGSVSMRKRGV
jgi:hypothetical protein